MDSRGALYVVVARRSNDGSLGGDGDGAIYRSLDGAAIWTKINLPSDVNGPHGLAVDPSDPRRLYLAAWGRRPDSETVGGGIHLSTDSGTTWQQVLKKDQHIYDITVDPKDPRVLYASGFDGSAWRSTDRGETWTRLRGFNFSGDIACSLTRWIGRRFTSQHTAAASGTDLRLATQAPQRMLPAPRGNNALPRFGWVITPLSCVQRIVERR